MSWKQQLANVAFASAIQKESSTISIALGGIIKDTFRMSSAQQGARKQ